MSTTSTNPDKQKSKENKSKNQGPLERYKLSQASRQSPPIRKWSNDRVIDELSSFIAEFSYLTDSPNKISQIESSKPPIKSYQTYPTNTAGNDGSPFNTTVAYDNRNSQKVKFDKKAVEWKDKEIKSPPHYKKQHRYPSNRDFPDSTYTTSAEERPKKSHYSRQKNKSSSRRHHYPRKHRSRDSDKSSKSRSKSKIRSPRKSKSKSRVKRKQSRPRSPSKKRSPISQLQYKRRRSEPNQKQRRSRPSNSKRSHYKAKRSTSDVTDGPRRQRRPRSRSSKSLYRYWPLRYEKKKKTRRRIVTKSIPVISKMGIKEFVPSESATIITLYPGLRPKEQRITHLDPDFLVNPALPCKCFDCMRKYKSLVKLPYPKHISKEVHPIKHSPLHGIRRAPPAPSPVPHGVGDIPQPVPCIHQKRVMQGPGQHVPDWFWYPGDITCMDEYCPSPESDQATERSYNSVHLKFNCYGHHIDSTITKYFHSILGESIYC